MNNQITETPEMASYIYFSKIYGQITRDSKTYALTTSGNLNIRNEMTAIAIDADGNKYLITWTLADIKINECEHDWRINVQALSPDGKNVIQRKCRNCYLLQEIKFDEWEDVKEAQL